METTTLDPLNISENFSQREFTAALQCVKPGKVLGLDSICSELIINAGAALKSWLHDFLFFLFEPTQNFQDLEKSACSRDPKADEACREPRVIDRYLYSVSPKRFSRGLSTPLSSQILTYCSLKGRLGFDA